MKAGGIEKKTTSAGIRVIRPACWQLSLNIHTGRYRRCNAQVEWPHHKSRIALNSVPKGKSNGPKNTQANRIRKLPACGRTRCGLNASTT